MIANQLIIVPNDYVPFHNTICEERILYCSKGAQYKMLTYSSQFFIQQADFFAYNSGHISLHTLPIINFQMDHTFLEQVFFYQFCQIAPTPTKKLCSKLPLINLPQSPNHIPNRSQSRRQMRDEVEAVRQTQDVAIGGHNRAVVELRGLANDVQRHHDHKEHENLDQAKIDGFQIGFLDVQAANLLEVGLDFGQGLGFDDIYLLLVSVVDFFGYEGHFSAKKVIQDQRGYNNDDANQGQLGVVKKQKGRRAKHGQQAFDQKRQVHLKKLHHRFEQFDAGIDGASVDFGFLVMRHGAFNNLGINQTENISIEDSAESGGTLPAQISHGKCCQTPALATQETVDQHASRRRDQQVRQLFQEVEAVHQNQAPTVELDDGP